MSHLLHLDASARGWAVRGPLLAELLAADLVLIGTPMYNFGVPAALKAWIDQVTFPKMTLPGTAHRESHAAALAEIDRLTAPENFAQLAGATGPAAVS